MLLYLVFDILQVRTQRLRSHPLDARLCAVQPVGELLQLLVLQVHEDFVESGTATGKDRENDYHCHAPLCGLWVTDEEFYALRDYTDEAKDLYLIDLQQNNEKIELKLVIQQ